MADREFIVQSSRVPETHATNAIARHSDASKGLYAVKARGCPRSMRVSVPAKAATDGRRTRILRCVSLERGPRRHTCCDTH